MLTDKEIQPLLTMEETMEAVEEAFKEKALGKTVMPSKSYILFDKYGGDFRVMPAYLENDEVAGVKIVNAHPNNPEKYTLPTVMASIVLLDPRTGAPLSIMNGTWITCMRTGGAGGVAAKYFARGDSKVVGLVGAGMQARTQIEALKTVLPTIEEVKVVDKYREVSEKFAQEVRTRLALKVRVVPTIKDAVIDADVVVAVTPSRKPLIMDEWIRKGTHINAIGADAPGKQELDPAILNRAKIVVDDVEQATFGGEVNVPLSKALITIQDIYAEIGEVIAKKKSGRVSSEEITLFDSTGLAIQDIATAWKVFKKAQKTNQGTWVSF